MPPAPTDPLFQALLSPFALLMLVWIVAAAALIRWPYAPQGARRMIGLGLGLAMAVGLGSLALARPFLTEGVLGLSSHWLFGAGLLLALAGVARAWAQSGGGQTR
jgi:hypothetical protein